MNYMTIYKYLTIFLSICTGIILHICIDKQQILYYNYI